MVFAQALRAVCDDLEKHDPQAPSLHFARGLLAAGVASQAVAPEIVGHTRVDEVVALTAKAFGLDPDTLLSSRRTDEIATARFAAMLVLRRQGASYPAIARMLRRNDHTTCIHGESRALDLERTSPAFADAVKAIAAGNVETVFVPRTAPKGKRSVHDERGPEIAAAYREGASIGDCAARFGVSVCTAKRLLRLQGVRMRPPGQGGRKKDYSTDERLPRIMAMRAEGATLEDIGREFRITRERVRQIVVAAGKKEEFAERPLKPHELAILEEYRNGAQLFYIAAKLGVGVTAAKRALVRHGIAIRPKGIAPRTQRIVAEVCRRYQAGETAAKIAVAVGLKDPAQIYRYLALAGEKPARQREAA